MTAAPVSFMAPLLIPVVGRPTTRWGVPADAVLEYDAAVEEEDPDWEDDDASEEAVEDEEESAAWEEDELSVGMGGSGVLFVWADTATGARQRTAAMAAAVAARRKRMATVFIFILYTLSGTL